MTEDPRAFTEAERDARTLDEYQELERQNPMLAASFFLRNFTAIDRAKKAREAKP